MMGAFISARALAAHLQNGSDVLVVDARSREAYAAAHVPGALSIPAETLAKRFADIPRDRTVVVYCSFRNPGHSVSEQVGVLLRESGYVVKVLYGGFPAWREAGLAIERPAKGGQDTP